MRLRTQNEKSARKGFLFTHKKGQAQSAIVIGITAFITSIIGLVIILQVFGGTSADVVDAFTGASNGSVVNNQTVFLPLSGLLSSSGVVALAYSAGVVIGLVGIALAVAVFMKFGKK